MQLREPSKTQGSQLNGATLHTCTRWADVAALELATELDVDTLPVRRPSVCVREWLNLIDQDDTPPWPWRSIVADIRAALRAPAVFDFVHALLIGAQ